MLIRRSFQQTTIDATLVRGTAAAGADELIFPSQGVPESVPNGYQAAANFTQEHPSFRNRTGRNGVSFGLLSIRAVASKSGALSS